MFTTPYQTTFCAQHILVSVSNGVKLARIEGGTEPAFTSSGKKLKGIHLLKPNAKSVPPFSQPLEVDGTWYVDTRAFLSFDREGQLKITSPNELDFLVIRAALSKAWAEDGATGLSLFQSLPTRVYSRFLSEAIVRRLGLDPNEQLQLAVIAAFFYLTQFEKEITLNDTAKTSYAMRISRATALSADKVLVILDKLSEQFEHITSSSMDDFCSYAKSVLTSARSSQINTTLIATSVLGMWWGAYAKETISTALEYPPYLNALIYSAIIDRSYNSTGFAKLVNQVGKNANLIGYQHAIVDYLSSLEG